MQRLPLARRLADRRRVERVQLIRTVPVQLNGGALYALRHLVGNGRPLSAFQFATWVQQLVDRELRDLRLPTAAEVRA